jgi:hypothetical protein
MIAGANVRFGAVAGVVFFGYHGQCEFRPVHSLILAIELHNIPFSFQCDFLSFKWILARVQSI